MSKYHIGKSGQPSECKAKNGKCPLGGAHFDSMGAAVRAHMGSASLAPMEPTPEEFSAYDLDETLFAHELTQDDITAYSEKSGENFEDLYAAHYGKVYDKDEALARACFEVGEWKRVLNRPLPDGRSPYMDVTEKKMVRERFENEGVKRYGLNHLQAVMFASEWADASFWERQPTGAPYELYDYTEALAEKYRAM